EEYERQAEGEQQGIVGRASVERPDEESLDEEPEGAHQQRREQERDEEAAGAPDQYEAEVGTQHVERAVRKIHDRHQAEDQRQTDGEQHEDSSEHQSREDLGGEGRQRD